MDINKKMQPVIRDINSFLAHDPESNKSSEVRIAISKWSLDEKETKHICRHFGLLLEDVE